MTSRHLDICRKQAVTKWSLLFALQGKPVVPTITCTGQRSREIPFSKTRRANTIPSTHRDNYGRKPSTSGHTRDLRSLPNMLHFANPQDKQHLREQMFTYFLCAEIPRAFQYAGENVRVACPAAAGTNVCLKGPASKLRKCVSGPGIIHN